MPNSELLTPKETAELLKVSIGRVYFWIKIGSLKGYKITGSRIIRLKKSEVVKSLKVEGEDESGEHLADKV